MMAKDDFIALIPTDTHYDWIAKSNTLFGDPELPMYTAIPEEMEIGELAIFEGLLDLTVSVTSGGSPLQGARVCLLQGEWDEPVTYAIGITDASGNADLSWPVEMPALPNEARITVWARDHELLTGIHEVYNMGIQEETQPVIPTLSLLSSNPVSGTAAISWSLPESQTGELSIIDLTGRTLEKHVLQGTQGLFNWQATENPAGIYFARITTSSGQNLRTRLVVIR